MNEFSCLLCKHNKECSQRFDFLESTMDIEELEEIMDSDERMKANNDFNSDGECGYFES